MLRCIAGLNKNRSLKKMSYKEYLKEEDKYRSEKTSTLPTLILEPKEEDSERNELISTMDPSPGKDSLKP